MLNRNTEVAEEVADSDWETAGDSHQEESEDYSLFVYSVKSSCGPEEEQFYEVIVVKDTNIDFQLDSGAKANVMPLRTSTISSEDH